MASDTETRDAASQDYTAAGGGAHAAAVATATLSPGMVTTPGIVTAAVERMGTTGALAALGRMAAITASAVGTVFDRETEGTCVSARDRANAGNVIVSCGVTAGALELCK